MENFDKRIDNLIRSKEDATKKKLQDLELGKIDDIKKTIKEAVKNIKIPETKRINVIRPKWIDELKQEKYNDTKLIEAVYKVSSNVKNSKVTEVTVKQPVWYKGVDLVSFLDKLKKVLFRVEVKNKVNAILVDKKGKEINFSQDESVKKIIEAIYQIPGGGDGGGGLTLDESNATIGVSQETTLQSVLAKLQEVADNTDELELKADTINLNTDGIEGRLDEIITALGGGYYDKRIDESHTGYTYIGIAKPGTATSEEKWQIYRWDEIGEATKTHADGTSTFDKEWDERLNYSY